MPYLPARTTISKVYQIIPLIFCLNPNVAKVGGHQSPGVKGEAVVAYCDPLTTQNLKTSGFPRCFQGKQHGKIDPILRVHRWRYPRTLSVARILTITTDPYLPLALLFMRLRGLDSENNSAPGKEEQEQPIVKSVSVTDEVLRR